MSRTIPLALSSHTASTFKYSGCVCFPQHRREQLALSQFEVASPHAASITIQPGTHSDYYKCVPVKEGTAYQTEENENWCGGHSQACCPADTLAEKCSPGYACIMSPTPGAHASSCSVIAQFEQACTCITSCSSMPPHTSMTALIEQSDSCFAYTQRSVNVW
jgi:hypothetical protein